MMQSLVKDMVYHDFNQTFFNRFINLFPINNYATDYFTLHR